MGDRAYLICKSVHGYSPTIYVHWLGHDVPEIIKDAWPLMRHGDNSYASAALCVACYERASRGGDRTQVSVGLYPTPDEVTPELLSDFNGHNPGDLGTFVIDVDTGLVECFQPFDRTRETWQLPMRPMGHDNPDWNGWDQDNSREIAKRAAAEQCPSKRNDNDEA